MVASFSRIVHFLYCGCCPWDRCPNLGPAFKRLHDWASAREVLYLANNLGADWVAKGYRLTQSLSEHRPEAALDWKRGMRGCSRFALR